MSPCITVLSSFGDGLSLGILEFRGHILRFRAPLGLALCQITVSVQTIFFP